MFDIGWGEFLVIGIVALIAIGPKELPTVLRTMGQWMGKVRRMASEFRGQWDEAMREAEMADLKKGFDDIKDKASSFTNFNPIDTARQEMQSAFEGLKTPSTTADGTTTAAASATASEAGATDATTPDTMQVAATDAAPAPPSTTLPPSDQPAADAAPASAAAEPPAPSPPDAGFVDPAPKAGGDRAA